MLSGLAGIPQLKAQTITVTTSVLSDYNGEDITCADNCDGIAIASPSGGVPPYSYLWSDGQTNAVAIGLCAGTHTVDVTDALGLVVVTASVVVVPPPLLTVDATAFAFAGGFNISCHGEDDGQTSATASGGTGSYSFLWGDGQSGPNAVDLFAGSIFVQVTDDNFCTAVDTVELLEPNPIQAGASLLEDVACAGRGDGRIAVILEGGSPGYSFNWADGASGSMRDGLIPGTYSVSVVDLVGCTFDTTFSIATRPALVVQLDSLQSATCPTGADGAVAMGVAGGTPPYAYRWSHGPLTEDLPAIASGEYLFSVVDDRGCPASSAVTIPQRNQLTVSALKVQPSCGQADGRIHLNTSGAAGSTSFLWSDGQTTSSATALQAGAYSVLVSDAECTINKTLLLSSSSGLELALSSDPSDCGLATGSATASVASGGEPPFSWLWSDGQSTATAVGLPAARHWVQAEDALGCRSLAFVQVNEDPADLDLSSSSIDPSGCGLHDGSINLGIGAGTPPFSIAWNTGASTGALDQLPAGLYQAVVNDGAGCSDTLRLALTDVAIAYTATATAIDCGAANGALALSTIGGTLPLQLDWSHGDSGANPSMLVGAAYTLMLTDADGCRSYFRTTLEAPSGILACADVQGISCEALDDGAIDLSVEEGLAPFAFAWNTGASSEDLSGLEPGTYSVEIVDAADCLVQGPMLLGDGCTLPLDAVDDAASPIEGLPSTIVVLDNDSYPVRPDIFVALIDLPLIGTAVLEPDFSVTYTQPEGNPEPDSFTYRLCNGFGLCDTATVFLDVLAQFQLPDAFSPNGDGINDRFEIRGIDAFPSNTLTVFNRWGDRVYLQRGYLGEWSGTDQSGKPLPDGTYYFTLDLGDGSAVRTGPLEIHR
jgi:gliding motility-associated-like protein